ncbi:MAG: BCCT family transporter, partial [Pseudomonadota bacterium]
EAMKSLPLTELLVPILLCLAFISYVTAADSNTEAISQICRRHDHGPESNDDELESGPKLKIVWVLLLAGMAWVMVAFSGVDGVRMLSNVGGLPALFIVIGLQLALIRMAFRHSQIGAASFQSAELVDGRT